MHIPVQSAVLTELGTNQTWVDEIAMPTYLIAWPETARSGRSNRRLPVQLGLMHRQALHTSLGIGTEDKIYRALDSWRIDDVLCLRFLAKIACDQKQEQLRYPLRLFATAVMLQQPGQKMFKLFMPLLPHG